MLRAASTLTDDSAFLAAFESLGLDPATWDHAAHIRLAFVCLSVETFEGALARVRRGIRAFNAHAVSLGHESKRGYHETITVAWLRLVAAAMERDWGEASGGSRGSGAGASGGGGGSGGAGDSSLAFCTRHPELLERRRLLDHYTEARLMSREALEGFIEPDVAPLPRARDVAGRLG